MERAMLLAECAVIAPRRMRIACCEIRIFTLRRSMSAMSVAPDASLPHLDRPRSLDARRSHCNAATTMEIRPAMREKRMSALHKILIVGGGTAGWLTANYLARTLQVASGHSLSIELVESSDIGILGVGEGTFPSIRGTLSAIGLDEARFVREANATFKQGIRFDHWLNAPGDAGSHHYFHPFSLPSQRERDLELLPYWLLGAAGDDVAFAEAATMQKHVADRSRA